MALSLFQNSAHSILCSLRFRLHAIRASWLFTRSLMYFKAFPWLPTSINVVACIVPNTNTCWDDSEFGNNNGNCRDVNSAWRVIYLSLQRYGWFYAYHILTKKKRLKVRQRTLASEMSNLKPYSTLQRREPCDLSAPSLTRCFSKIHTYRPSAITSFAPYFWNVP